MGQATYRDITNRHLPRLEDFTGNSMSAEWQSDPSGYAVYRVYSYGTCIAEWWPGLDGGTYVENETRYSVTTARHQGCLWALERSLPVDRHHVVFDDVYRGTHRLHSERNGYVAV